MKAVVLNPMVCILGWVDHHVLLGSVQHVGHAKALEVGDVTHCLSIPNDDARMHLVAVDRPPLLLLLPTPCSCCSPAPHQVLVHTLLMVQARGQSSAALVLGYGQPVLV